MTTFVEDLWQSVFTAGPTPTLLLATNATFAVLEFVLVILLVVTQSIHFVVLIVLASGLWFSINWFSNEVKAASEEIRRREAAEKELSAKTPRGAAAGAEADDEDGGDDTETEVERVHLPLKVEAEDSAATTGVSATQSSSSLGGKVSLVQRNVDSPATLTPFDGTSRQKQRRSLSDSTGELSTDSEWEQIGSER